MTNDKTPSFTGRARRRRTTWAVRAIDRLAQGLIVAGGVGTIVAVSMVCVFLLWVVLPLFAPATVAPPSVSKAEWGDAKPWHVAIDEYDTLGWALFGDGSIEVFRVDGRDRSERRTLFDGAPMTAAAFTVADGRAAFGFSDGTFRLGNIRFSSKPPPQSEAVELDGPPMEGRPRQSLVVALGAPLDSGSATAIRAIDLSVRPSGHEFLCTLSADGVVRWHSVRKASNFETGEETRQVRHVELPLPADATETTRARVMLSGVGDNAFVAWPDGRLLRFDLRDPNSPQLAEEVDLVSESSARLTALTWMIGKTTLVAGDSLGRVRGWFRVHREDASTSDGGELVAAHDLAGGASPVTSLAASARSRMLAVGYADGTVRLFYVTNDALLAESSVPSPRDVTALAICPKDDGLVGATSAERCHWRLDVKHPEVSMASLFLPVWYEGHDRPTHDWQSTGGTDDFEPKLGLLPLVFGTLKVTVYSLLFGVPLALLGAVYTSEFLPKRTRAKVKPAIEMMASLPSVVLGFIAALVLAPLVEGCVPGLLASLATVPLGLLCGAYLWQLLPTSLRVQWSHGRFVLMCLSLPVGLAAGLRLGPPLERLAFAGDIKAWLDGRQGIGAGGWLLIFVPLSSLLAAWLLGTYVNPFVRQRSRDWSESRAAKAELAKFLVAAAAVVGTAALAAWLAGAAGLDPRGTFVDSYKQRNVLIVGFVMGFAIIPIIYTIAEDALASVPEHLRSASLGAGATRWQTATRIIIPTAMSGLFSAVMVGLGRAVGETMIVLMAAGNTPIMEWNLFNGGRSLSANIAVELAEAVRDSTHYRTLFFAALVLFAMTFVLNTLAETVRQRFRKRAYQL
jgi:phosphate transport system permease protein